MPKKFKKDIEISPKDMVQYGLDHMGAGFYLFRDRPEFYDSAGYLIHIGFECLLKGWWLEQDGEIHAEHDLVKLSKKIKDFDYQNLNAEYKMTIAQINKFQHLRYPDLINPTEIGSEVLESIVELVKETLLKMPKLLRPKEEDDFIRKGNRILMKKPLIRAAKKVIK